MDQINFTDERLIKRHGNWIKVQVAFYDFIMKAGMGKPDVSFEVLFEFKNGLSGYDNMVAGAFDLFETPELAWKQFLIDEGINT